MSNKKLAIILEKKHKEKEILISNCVSEKTYPNNLGYDSLSDEDSYYMITYGTTKYYN